MSNHLLTTNVIHCDGNGPDCEEVYADTAECSEESIEKFAQRDGWKKQPDGSHLCPSCFGRSIPHRPE